MRRTYIRGLSTTFMAHWFKGRIPELPNSKLGSSGVRPPSDSLTKLASVSCLGAAVVFQSL